MYNIGYEFKNSKDEILATVINVVNRGLSHGFNDESKYHPSIYVCKRDSNKGMTVVTVKESIIAGKERWSELDSVRDK